MASTAGCHQQPGGTASSSRGSHPDPQPLRGATERKPSCLLLIIGPTTEGCPINFTYKPAEIFASSKTPPCTVKRVCIASLSTARESSWQARKMHRPSQALPAKSIEPYKMTMRSKLPTSSLQLENLRRNDAPNNHCKASNRTDGPRFYVTAA